MRLNLNNADKVAFNGDSVNNVKFNGKPIWRDADTATENAAKYIHYTNGQKRKFAEIAIFGESSQSTVPSQESPATVTNTVNPTVRIVGKNVLKIYGFSARTLTTPNAARYLNNDYGTTIDKTDLIPADNPVLTVTQKTVRSETAQVSYYNGFIVIGVYNMVVGKSYTFSFNMDITNELLPGEYQSAVLNNSKGFRGFTAQNGVNKISFVAQENSTYQFIELRCGGMSFVIKDIIFCEGDVENTDFEPYCEQTVTVPYTLRAVPSSAGGFLARDSVEMWDGKVFYIKRISENLDLCTADTITDKTEYILSSPITEDITNTDTGVAILALYSDKINTVISDADIALKYVKQ